MFINKTVVFLSCVPTFALWFGILSGQEIPLKPSSTTVSSEASDEKPKFLRVEKDGKQPRALQVAVARYEIVSGPNQGKLVDLVGAVHVGTKQYYSELNQRFRNYDAVLYELVADPEVNNPSKRGEAGFNPVSGLQTGMKGMLDLSFQLDEVDYTPKNFVHADMSPTEFSQDMKKRNDGFLGMFARLMGAGFAVQGGKKGQQQQADMLAAMLSKDPMKMRRVMAEQFESMDGQMAGLADKDGKSTLLTERNRKAFEVLESELATSKKTFAIFYGAAHLVDMHERLLRDFQAKPKNVEWIDAWPLR
jgi:hypothetical protein